MERELLETYHKLYAVVKCSISPAVALIIKLQSPRERRHTDDTAEGTAAEVLGRVGLDLPKGKPAFLLRHVSRH